ncbi:MULTISPECIES: Abi family protein [unclassified Campylobacter]|uniref:Abi family protein n=1 Tax=unclassified Campylobacter TaxID=2593542 RepID=UPI0010FA5679|nr:MULTISPECIES: Abi family protein [unclassified Campylobacter]NDJ28055.1 Abi family protein [Campylobacter sp. MIT 19-121]
MKPKLSLDEQIKHMEAKGIQFNIINQNEAKDILSSRTYYFKLKSYAKIYNKDNLGRYVDLEFAYMYEISKIDVALRSFILDVALAIEHLAKTLLLNDFNQSNEDGYSIIERFLDSEEGQNTQKTIESYLNGVNLHSGGNYALVQKYHNQMPIWVLIEIISFNNFIKLLTFYQKDTNRKIIQNQNNKDIKLEDRLDSTKWLRNLSAHSNCILIKILDTTTRKYMYKQLSAYRKNFVFKDDTYTLESMMSKSLVVDFLEMIHLFFKICKSRNMKNNFITNFNDFMQYVRKYQETLNSNQKLKNFFEFIEKSFNIIKN